MKRWLLLLTTIVVMAIGLNSCKKDYACKCTATGSGDTVEAEGSTFRETKNGAEEFCAASENISAGITVTCVAVRK